MKKSIYLICIVGFVCAMTGCSQSSDSGSVSSIESKSNSSTAVTSKGTSEKAGDIAFLKQPEQANSFFVVDHYDPQRDADEDLALTTELASQAGKRILIEVGGKW